MPGEEAVAGPGGIILAGAKGLRDIWRGGANELRFPNQEAYDRYQRAKEAYAATIPEGQVRKVPLGKLGVPGLGGKARIVGTMRATPAAPPPAPPPDYPPTVPGGFGQPYPIGLEGAIDWAGIDWYPDYVSDERAAIIQAEAQLLEEADYDYEPVMPDDPGWVLEPYTGDFSGYFVEGAPRVPPPVEGPPARTGAGRAGGLAGVALVIYEWWKKKKAEEAEEERKRKMVVIRTQQEIKQNREMGERIANREKQAQIDAEREAQRRAAEAARIEARADPIEEVRVPYYIKRLPETPIERIRVPSRIKRRPMPKPTPPTAKPRWTVPPWLETAVRLGDVLKKTRDSSLTRIERTVLPSLPEPDFGPALGLADAPWPAPEPNVECRVVKPRAKGDKRKRRRRRKCKC